MKIKRNGEYRNVILMNKFAIKIPVITTHLRFLKGCKDNWSENVKYKEYKNYEDLKSKVPIVYFTFLFGLFSIQERCVELNRELSFKEKEEFKQITHDIKKENFGFSKKTSYLVCIDFA